MKTVSPRSSYTYRCQYCGFECVKNKLPQSGVGVTKTGDYGDNATPTPTVYVDQVIEATTLSFLDGTDYIPFVEDRIYDAAYGFCDAHFSDGWGIRIVSDSGVNDGDYTIAQRGVSRGQILLTSTGSLTTENAASAGTVTISRLIYKPNVTTGCPFCGSLNSK